MDLPVGVGPQGEGEPAGPAAPGGVLAGRGAGLDQQPRVARASRRSRTAPARSPRSRTRPPGTPRRPTRSRPRRRLGAVGVGVGERPGRGAQASPPSSSDGAEVAALGQAGEPAPRGERDVPGGHGGERHQGAPGGAGGQRVRAVADDVGQAAGAAHAAARRVALEPGVLELAAVIGTTDPGAGPRRRVVDHHVAGAGEPDDHHQVPVASRRSGRR